MLQVGIDIENVNDAAPHAKEGECDGNEEEFVVEVMNSIPELLGCDKFSGLVVLEF